MNRRCLKFDPGAALTMGWSPEPTGAAELTREDVLAIIDGAGVGRPVLSKRDLSGLDRSGVAFRGADLTGVDASDADFSDADLEGASLSRSMRGQDRRHPMP